MHYKFCKKLFNEFYCADSWLYLFIVSVLKCSAWEYICRYSPLINVIFTLKVCYFLLYWYIVVTFVSRMVSIFLENSFDQFCASCVTQLFWTCDFCRLNHLQPRESFHLCRMVIQTQSCPHFWHFLVKMKMLMELLRSSLIWIQDPQVFQVQKRR